MPYSSLPSRKVRYSRGLTVPRAKTARMPEPTSAALALLASLWNGVYNTAFDWFEGRLTGRPADLRPWLARMLHATGFELGILLMGLPLIVWWTGMSWRAALIADIGLAVAYVAYAFVFNLAYDKVFPIAQPVGESR